MVCCRESVQGGSGSTTLACGACHLMTGQGHPESADIAGMPVEYLVRQMADFKNGTRKDPARMNAIAKVTSEEDSRKAAEWFAALKPTVWVKVQESQSVPKSYVAAKGRMRLPLPSGGTEPLGNRIVELPRMRPGPPAAIRIPDLSRMCRWGASRKARSWRHRRGREDHRLHDLSW